MSKIALTPNASGTGTLTIAAPNTNTDSTINLPDSSGSFVTANTSGDVVINGSLDLDNGLADGAQIVFRSQGNPYFYIDNYAGDLRTISNGIERMRIDSSGRVTMPYQPSFCVRGVSTTTTPANTVFKVSGLTTVITNVGGYYNTSTTRFTAPVSGIYQVIAIITSPGQVTTSNYFGAIIYKNGADIGRSYSNRAANVYNQAVINLVVNLNTNDYIELYSDTNAVIDIELYRTHFMGYLIG